MADDDYDFFLCVGDQLPFVQETLLNGDGTPVDLTNATVAFAAQDENHADVAFGGSATPQGLPTSGVVRYMWQSSDSNAAGVYLYRWIVTFSGGLKETFPNGHSPRRMLISQTT